MNTVTIIFDWDGDPWELTHIVQRLAEKIGNIAARDPECICTHPESDDQIRNINGYVVGEVKLMPHRERRKR